MLALTDARTDAIDALHAATAIYTRSPVIKDLLDLTDWPAAPGVLADTSCGDGAFIVEATRRLSPQPGDVAALRRIRGWELHPGACASARAAVREELAALGWHDGQAAEEASRMIIEADFLVQPPPERSITFAVGNPPFLTRRNIPPLLRAQYETAVARCAQGDMLHAFLDACSAALTEDGVIALVTADRWLFNATAAELRSKLGKRVGIAHLKRLNPETSFHRPKFRRTGTPPRVHPVAVVMRRAGPELATISESPTYPPDQGQATTPTASGEAAPLSSLARVRLGPWLGPKGIFYLPLTEALAKGIEPVDLVRVVDTSDIPPDRDDLLTPTLVAIRTHRDREPTGAVRAHLEREIHQMPARGRQGSRWWMPPEQLPQPELADGVLIPRIANRLRAVPLPRGIVPINHNLHITSTTPRISQRALLQILRDTDVQRAVTSRAPRLENGFFDIRTGFARNLPIPTHVIDDAFASTP